MGLVGKRVDKAVVKGEATGLVGKRVGTSGRDRRGDGLVGKRVRTSGRERRGHGVGWVLVKVKRELVGGRLMTRVESESDR